MADETLNERDRFVADQYDIDDPDFPLSEWGMGRFAARDLIDFALDECAVPKNDDNGAPLSRRFRLNWLEGACQEAEGSG